MSETTNRIKIYCEPRIKLFLTESWLHMGFWEATLNLPKVLAQLGMAGNITAYGDTDILENFSFDDENPSSKDDEFSIFFVNTPKKVTTLRFFRNGDESQNTCIIPGYDGEYTSNFAKLEEKENVKTYFFYDISEYDWSICPRFSKEYHKNGIICTETTEAEYIRVTFMVKRLSDCTTFLTIVIKNTENPKIVIDAYKQNILNVLNTEKAKSVVTQYEKIRKYISHITSDYIFSCKTQDGKTTDELVILNGKAEKFTVTSNGKLFTLYKSQNWQMKEKSRTIKCKNNKFSFSNTKFSFPELQNLEEAVTNAELFVRENMKFVFEDQS